MEWKEEKQELPKQKSDTKLGFSTISLLDLERLQQNIHKEASALLTDLQESKCLGVLDLVISLEVMKEVMSFIRQHDNVMEKRCICGRSLVLNRNSEAIECVKEDEKGPDSNNKEIITEKECKGRDYDLERAISLQKKSHSCTSYACSICQKQYASHNQESTTMLIHEGNGGDKYYNTSLERNACFNEKKESMNTSVEDSKSEMITKEQIEENYTENTKENDISNTEKISATRINSRNMQLRKEKETDSMHKERLSCDKCKQAFPTQNQLFQHMRMVHCSGHLQRKFHTNRCEMCGKFVSISNVDKHQCLPNERDELRKSKVHETVNLKCTMDDESSQEETFSRFKCNDCGKFYFGKANFQRHKKTHVKHKGFKCKICEQSFTMADYLKQHVKKVHNKALYKTNSKTTANYTDALVLTLSHGGKESIVESENDNKIPIIKLKGNEKDEGNYKQNLAPSKEIGDTDKDAVREKHKIKDFAITNKNTDNSRQHCSECGKCFIGIRNLKKHLKTHSKDKIYNCVICGQDFAISDYLTKHMRRHHKLLVSVRDAKKCPVCGKFILASYFDFHCLNHKDELRPKTEEGKTKSLLGKAPNGQNEEEEETKCDSKIPQCNHGGRTFPHQKSYDEHMSRHLKGAQFSCTTCGIHFPQPSKLTVHLNRFHLSDSQKCGICGEAFATMSELKEHMTEKQCLNSHSSPEKSRELYICQVCGVTAHTFGGLVVHAKSHSNWKECKVCGKTFKEKRHLVIHERIHTREMPYSCDVCGKSFRWIGNLRDHKRTHTGETACMCGLCGVSFASISGLKRHKLRHTSTEEVELCGKFESSFCVCKTCGKVFRSDEGLSHHIQNHESMKNFPCNSCEKQFLYIGELQSHNTAHTRDKHTCAKCGASFKNRGQFFSHLKIHPIEKPFLCQICGKSFSTSHYLKYHTALHNGVNLRPSKGPYCCELCGKVYQSKSSLCTHMKIHNNIYDFPCDFCEKKFKSAPELRVHRRVHTKEQPYKCTICDRRFSRHSSLAVHKKTHSDERPYKCLTCNATFRIKRCLVKHREIHTRENHRKIRRKEKNEEQEIQAETANDVWNKTIVLHPEINLTGSGSDIPRQLDTDQSATLRETVGAQRIFAPESFHERNTTTSTKYYYSF